MEQSQKLETSNNKIYKVEVICDNKLNAKKVVNKLSGLYHLIS